MEGEVGYTYGVELREYNILGRSEKREIGMGEGRVGTGVCV
jgi:hypothetical protein